MIVVALSAAAQSTFELANQAYDAQRYADAVALYDSVEVEQGVSMQLYFNRGNAYYKMQQYAPAILNYERALRLSPGNSDVRYNLTLVNTKIVDKIEEKGTFFINVWAAELRDLFSVNTWAVIGIVSFFIFLAGIVVYFYTDVEKIRLKKWGFFVALLMIVISIMANACAITQNNRYKLHNEAIVFDDEISVKSSPSDTGTELFLLHEGTKVLIMETVGDWMEIQIPDGNRGWLPISAVQII